jgi:hypothetical protein
LGVELDFNKGDLIRKTGVPWPGFEDTGEKIEAVRAAETAALTASEGVFSLLPCFAALG